MSVLYHTLTTPVPHPRKDRLIPTRHYIHTRLSLHPYRTSTTPVLLNNTKVLINFDILFYTEVYHKTYIT